MPRARKQPISNDNVPASRPPITIEAQENRLISLATRLAEKQLMDGTASSQVITHYLKLGSTKEREERRMLQKNIELIEAKTEKINSEKKSSEMYDRVVEAMRSYSGLYEDPDVY